MPAIPMLLLSGMLERLDERDAAKAQAAQTQRESEAEIASYTEKKRIDAYYEALAKQSESRNKQQEHLQNLQQTQAYAQSIEAARPGVRTIINPLSYDVREIEVGEDGLPLEQVQSIIGPTNQMYANAGYDQMLVEDPLPNGNFTWKRVERPEEEETADDLMARLADVNEALGTTNADWDVKIEESGGYSASLKTADGQKRTREEAEALIPEIERTLKPGQTTRLKESAQLGWTVEVVDSKEKATLDPTKFSTKYAEPIPYGNLYYLMAGTGIDYDTAKGIGSRALVVDLTPDASLTYQPNSTQDQFEPGRDFKVFSPVSSDGSTMNVTDRLRQFFTTFRKGDFEVAIRNRKNGGNEVGYKDLLSQLETLSYAFTQDSKDVTDQFIRLTDPAQAGVFVEELQMLKSLSDPAFARAMDKGYNRAVSEANEEVGLPGNTPLSPDEETGGRRTAKRPSIVESSLIERDNDGVPYWNTKFEKTVEQATANGVVPEDLILDIVEVGMVPGSNQAGTPEGAVAAANSLDRLSKTFMKVYPEPSMDNAQTISSNPYTQKTFGSLATAEFRRSVAAFPTLEDRLLAVQSSLPAHMVQGVAGATVIGKGSQAQQAYELIAGGRPFKEIASEGENARKTIETGTQVIDLLDAGARPGVLGEVERAKAAVNYLFTESVDAVTGQTSPPIGTPENVTMMGPDGQPRTYTASSQIQGELNSRLGEIQSMKVFDEDSAQRQKDALLKFNLTVLSYAYAAMLDPNGRLSDADREAADRAIGNSLLATPNSIRPVVNEILSRANYMRTRAVSYTGGNPTAIFAMKTYDDLAGEEDMVSVTDLLDKFLVQRSDAERVQQSGGAGASRNDMALELGGGAVPSTPVPNQGTGTVPAPNPANENQNPTGYTLF